MQKFSYHTHTTFSDGKNSLIEMLEQAVKIGFTEIGISDHLIINENIKTIPDWHKEESEGHFNTCFFESFDGAHKVLSERIKYIRESAKNYSIKVLVGFEVDFFEDEGWIDSLKKLRTKLDVDYLLFGNHYFSYNNIVWDIEEVIKENLPEKELLAKKYFQNIKAAIRSKTFDFVAHIDYSRKCCEKLPFYGEEIEEIVAILAETNTPFELSTKGLRKGQDYFPAHWIFEKLKEKNVPVVISDDAHHITQLGENFDKAEALLISENYNNRWKI